MLVGDSVNVDSIDRGTKGAAKVCFVFQQW